MHNFCNFCTFCTFHIFQCVLVIIIRFEATFGQVLDRVESRSHFGSNLGSSLGSSLGSPLFVCLSPLALLLGASRVRQNSAAWNGSQLGGGNEAR